MLDGVQFWADFCQRLLYLKVHCMLPFADPGSWHLEGDGKMREQHVLDHPFGHSILKPRPTIEVAIQIEEDYIGVVAKTNILDAAHAVVWAWVA